MTNLKTLRILSFLIDFLLISLILTLVTSFIDIKPKIGSIDFFGFNIIYGYSFYLIFYFIYFFVFEFLGTQSIGKMIFKLKISSKVTNTLNFKTKLLRVFLKNISIYILPISATIFLINDFIIQDYYSKTIVSSKK